MAKVAAGCAGENFALRQEALRVAVETGANMTTAKSQVFPS
jgi:hypothetical protein